MPPIKANSKDGQGHKDKDLVTRNAHVQYESSNMYKKNNETTERSYHKETSCEITLALTVQKLLARFKFSKKMGQTPRSRSQGKR